MNNQLPLSEVSKLISRGISPKYDNEGVVVLNQRCVRNNRVDFANARFTNRLSTKIRSDKYIQQWDVLVNSTGVGTLGRVGQILQPINDVTVDSHVTIVRPNFELMNGRYFGYALISKENYIATLGAGATGQTELSRIRLSEVEIPIHSLSEQLCIASILSSYDDLIDNNTRRIQILEEMAQRIYTEWFVHFRFPGHEKVKMVGSELGKIPSGWEIVPFTEVSEVLSGGTPKTKVPEYWDGPIPFFTPKDAQNSFFVNETAKSVTEIGLSKCSSQLYSPDTVFITARGTVGKVVLPGVDMAMNQSCYALKGKDGISHQYLFLMTLQQVDYLKKNTGGATFDTIIVDTFRRMKVLKPNNDIIQQFTKLVKPLFDFDLNCILCNRNLRQTRDLLLPKLISGEIDVSEIPDTEEAAAA